MCLYVTGNKTNAGWRDKESSSDIFYIKGVCEKLFQLSGINDPIFKVAENLISVFGGDELLGKLEAVDQNKLKQFSIKQPVFFADINWDKLCSMAKEVKIEYAPLIKYPEVHRDLSIVISKNISYESVEAVANSLNLSKLTAVNLFDIFESEKLGADKRSLAINFTFLDTEKTLTDKDIDAMMNKLIISFEKQLNAEIRKG